MTLTEGVAALHQAILGDRLRLSLDAAAAQRIGAGAGTFAHPGLVWDVAIGQSTLITQRVIANLFYRGLRLHRLPRIGDTLRTSTEVVGLRDLSSRPAGLAALRIRTVDQADRAVLDFVRCAMLPLAPGADPPGHNDDVGSALELRASELSGGFFSDWELGAEAWPPTELAPGSVLELEGGDLVSNATALARLSLNLAMVHHDSSAAGGRRLVYGGHTIGIAAAQASRALPNLVTIVGWHSCDHLAPVYEGDTLHSAVEVERRHGNLAHLRSRVEARRPCADPVAVLDWRFVAVLP